MCTVAVRVEAVAAVLAVIQQQALDEFPPEDHGNIGILLDNTMLSMQVWPSARACLNDLGK